MNLIELLIFLAMLMCGYWGALYGSHHFGNALWAIPGAIIGFLVPIGGLFFLAIILDLAIGGRPHIPHCREGTCRGDSGYEHVKAGEEYHRVCKHGVHYQRRGRRFVIIKEDGAEEPHLIWRPFRGWFPDKPK